MSPEPTIPTPQDLHAEFYAHAQGGVLHLQQCADCARFRHPPRYRCPSCTSGRFGWTPSPGHGHLYSWTVTHLAVDPGWAGEIPYVTGVVELDEGVRLLGSVDGIGVAELRIGLPIATRLVPQSSEFTLLLLQRGTSG